MTHSAIRTAIIEMNESLIGNDKIGIVLKVAPLDEEIEQVTNYDGDTKLLGEPEKFFLEVKSIANIVNRLESWAFKMKFDGEFQSLLPDIESITMATREMKESKKFIEFLTLVLATCNYLNAKGRKKNSYGFKMMSLSKLQDTRTVDGKSNLLLYLIDYMDRQCADLLSFNNELPNVSVAKRVSIAAMKETISNMNKSLNQVAKHIELLQKSSADQTLPENDKYLTVMEPFYKVSKEKVDLAKSKYDAMITSLEELSELYDEDKTIMTTKPEDFFKEVDTFLTMFDSAKKKLAEQKAKDAKKQQLEQKKAAEKVSIPPNNSILPNKKNEEMEKKKGLVEALEISLREGSALKRRGTPVSLKDNIKL